MTKSMRHGRPRAGLRCPAVWVVLLIGLPSAMAQNAPGAEPVPPGRDATLGPSGGKRAVAAGWKASWSPDGKRLVFGKPQGRGLQILTVADGSVADLTDSGKDPVWSPDGRWIAFVKEPAFNAYLGEETWIVNPEGRSARKVVDGGYPNWSGDGKRLIVHVRREPKLVAIEVDHPEPKPQTFYEGAMSWYPAVSPDEKRIAFGQRGALVVVERSTGKVLLTWPVPGSRGLLPAWSPDGKQVGFGGFDNDPTGLWIVDVDAQRAVRVATGTYTLPAWSQDGRWLAFDYRGPAQREVWTIETQGLDQRRVVTLAEAQAAVPSAPAADPFAQSGFAIGSEAPEIEGEDIDGVRFKLSDYRGGVVVLDFWGDW